MKKLLSILLTIILLTSILSINTFAEDTSNNNTITIYFDPPKSFDSNHIIECSYWGGLSYEKTSGELLESGLYKFDIPDFNNCDGFSFIISENKNDNLTTKSSLTFYADNGQIDFDMYGTSGSPDNLVFANVIYYEHSDFGPMPYYLTGEWMTLSKWHRNKTFYNFMQEQGAEFPDILSEEEVMDLWYLYNELYLQYDENENLIYALAFGSSPEKTTDNIYEIFSTYLLRQDESYVYDFFGYYVYIAETDSFVTLREAFDQNVPYIEEVFTTYGLGELIGDVDGNNILNILDATKIQRCIANIDEFSANDEITGETTGETIGYISDFNRDSNRDILDATKIQQYLAKIKD